MNIVFTFDENVIAPLAACLRSLSLSNPNPNLVVHLVHGFPPNEELQGLQIFCDELGINSEFIEISNSQFKEISETLAGQPHLSPGALYRCKIGSILPESIERVLYIDCDTLILESLDSLYGRDMDGKVVLAHRTPMSHLKELGVEESDYFNSGVMLIDLGLWRSIEIEKKLFETLMTVPDKLQWHDQCALNAALVGKTGKLERRYNYMFQHLNLPEEFENPAIIHYAGSRKPWTCSLRHPWGGLYFEMASRTPWIDRINLYGEPEISTFRRKRRKLLRSLGLRK